MSRTPTFAIHPSFLGIRNADRSAPLVIVGIPLDIGTTNRPKAPLRIGKGSS